LTSKSTNQTKKPGIGSRLYDHLVFGKGAKVKPWGKERLFKKWCSSN
jgi:hypothetical protein